MATLYTHPGSLPRHNPVATIGIDDLKEALRKGVDDFSVMPTHIVFLGLIYPLFGFILSTLVFSADAWQLAFPLVSGFAIVGPAAAIGLYELSRRREQGLDTSPISILAVRHTPAIGSIVALALLLFAILLAWLGTAELLYRWLYGDNPPADYLAFLADVVSTRRGVALAVIGTLVGAAYAALAFCISVVAFPLMLDKGVGVGEAIATSIEAVRTNPVPMAAWGLIVAVSLLLGSLPLLVGLAVVVPILGHATWHLYRRLIPKS